MDKNDKNSVDKTSSNYTLHTYENDTSFQRPTVNACNSTFIPMLGIATPRNSGINKISTYPNE